MKSGVIDEKMVNKLRADLIQERKLKVAAIEKLEHMVFPRQGTLSPGSQDQGKWNRRTSIRDKRHDSNRKVKAVSTRIKIFGLSVGRCLGDHIEINWAFR